MNHYTDFKKLLYAYKYCNFEYNNKIHLSFLVYNSCKLIYQLLFDVLDSLTLSRYSFLEIPISLRFYQFRFANNKKQGCLGKIKDNKSDITQFFCQKISC